MERHCYDLTGCCPVSTSADQCCEDSRDGGISFAYATGAADCGDVEERDRIAGAVAGAPWGSFTYGFLLVAALAAAFLVVALVAAGADWLGHVLTARRDGSAGF